MTATETETETETVKTCIVEGCEELASPKSTKGYCVAHAAEARAAFLAKREAERIAREERRAKLGAADDAAMAAAEAQLATAEGDPAFVAFVEIRPSNSAFVNTLRTTVAGDARVRTRVVGSRPTTTVTLGTTASLDAAMAAGRDYVSTLTATAGPVALGAKFRAAPSARGVVADGR